jgi:hypothetical protein
MEGSLLANSETGINKVYDTFDNVSNFYIVDRKLCIDGRVLADAEDAMALDEDTVLVITEQTWEAGAVNKGYVMKSDGSRVSDVFENIFAVKNGTRLLLCDGFIPDMADDILANVKLYDWKNDKILYETDRLMIGDGPNGDVFFFVGEEFDEDKDGYEEIGVVNIDGEVLVEAGEYVYFGQFGWLRGIDASYLRGHLENGKVVIWELY